MNLFYELIQVALSNKDSLSETPSASEWRELYEISQKQAVAGVAFLALEKLSRNGQKPPKALLFEWIALSEQIRQRNLLADKRCVEITQMFADAGFESCILKGQGNALMYPVPESRTSGDIDIWVFGERKEITSFVKKRCADAFEQYHHIDFPIFDDVPVEVHYTPGRLLSPKYNRRLQNWFGRQKGVFISKKEINKGFNVPSVAFNAVYQMVHVMMHFFIEGIGLRHFIDYYYALIKVQDSGLKVQEIVDTMRWLGLEKFATGVMWIEQYCLGLEDRYLLFEPSERIGKIILKEMEEGGNFGQYDERYTLRSKGLLARGVTDAYRLLQLSTIFPNESMWKIYNKIENQKWKIKARKGKE